MEILGIRIDNLSRKEILEKIEFFLNKEKFHQIATVNPEFILQAQKDKEFKSILNQCDLNIADGVGIWYAFIRNFRFLKCRFAGIDLMWEILKIANEKKLSVFLAINKDGLSKYEEIKAKLEKKYPNLDIHGDDIEYTNPSSSKLQNESCKLVLCNFGAPFQEKFIHSLKSKTNGKIWLAMGVGGSFDFLTGKIKRAPKILRFLGLEWFYRFLQEPKYRFKRIFHAVIIFTLRVLIGK